MTTQPEDYDPTDDEDTPVEVESVEDTEPVALEEGSPAEVFQPPADWATQLSEEDLQERMAGTEITEDPEDGLTEDTN